jgi:hypothetical protein
MSSKKPSPALKCLEARGLLIQVEYVRSSCDVIATGALKDLDRMQYRAENLAGEAGYDAALEGASGQVPDCIQPYKVLANAFVAEYTQVIDHLRFEAIEVSAKTA